MRSLLLSLPFLGAIEGERVLTVDSDKLARLLKVVINRQVAKNVLTVLASRRSEAILARGIVTGARKRLHSLLVVRIVIVGVVLLHLTSEYTHARFAPQ